MRLLILADDLTGAADCAVGFAHAGHGAVVALEPAAPDTSTPHAPYTSHAAWALDTDTRRLAPALAAVRTATAYLAARGEGRRLYKKIDSTLRGPWASEVAGLQPLAGLAIVAPAHPALGRVVQGGGVQVHGQPLADTDIWRLEHGDRPAGIAEQLHAAGLRTAALDAQALSGQPGALAARIAALAAAGAQALVVDAQTVDALDTLALATGGPGPSAPPCPPLFWVGSGGLALALARLSRLTLQLPGAPGAQATQATSVPTLPAAQGPVLVLVGSLSRVSARQCAQLVQAGGIAECVLPPALLRGGAGHPDWAAQQARIGAQLAAGRDLLVRIGQDATFDPAEGPVLATALAALVGPHALLAGALLATGGETARALLAATGIASLQVLGETEPGLALGRVLQARTPQRPLVVTKAGAFGSDEALLRAWSLLRAPAHPTFPSTKETV